MVGIANYTELNAIYIMCKNDAFVAKKVNTRLTKVFMAIFALAERLATSATLVMMFVKLYHDVMRTATARRQGTTTVSGLARLPCCQNSFAIFVMRWLF